jgi:hypothetical protein
MLFKIRVLRTIFSVAFGLVAGEYATATPLLTNGGFEAGLTGWAASSFSVGGGNVTGVCCDTRFGLVGSGVSTVGQTGGAISGTYSLFGDFDGGTSISSQTNPATGKLRNDTLDFRLGQTFQKSGYYSSALLTFDFRVDYGQFSQYETIRDGGVLQRSLTATLSQGGTSSTEYSYLVPTDAYLVNNGLQMVSVSVDVSSFLNNLNDGNVTLDFDRLVPQNFTGQSYFELDNVSIGATPGIPPNSVPEPASLALLGLGFAGVAASRQRKKH